MRFDGCWREKEHERRKRSHKIAFVAIVSMFELVDKRCVLIFWRALGTTHSNMNHCQPTLKAAAVFCIFCKQWRYVFGYFWHSIWTSFRWPKNNIRQNKQTLHFIRMRNPIAQMHRKQKHILRCVYTVLTVNLRNIDEMNKNQIKKNRIYHTHAIMRLAMLHTKYS